MDAVIVVTVKDPEGKFYRDCINNRAGIFNFKAEVKNDCEAKYICEDNFRNFNALTQSKNIMVEISTLHRISGTYMVMYSYYGSEKRFIKH